MFIFSFFLSDVGSAWSDETVNDVRAFDFFCVLTHRPSVVFLFFLFFFPEARSLSVRTLSFVFFVLNPTLGISRSIWSQVLQSESLQFMLQGFILLQGLKKIIKCDLKQKPWRTKLCLCLEFCFNFTSVPKLIQFHTSASWDKLRILSCHYVIHLKKNPQQNKIHCFHPLWNCFGSAFFVTLRNIFSDFQKSS